MTTTANAACASWTRSVAVSPPRGMEPSTAPHVPIAPTRNADAAAPTCRKRSAAQSRKGKITYG